MNKSPIIVFSTTEHYVVINDGQVIAEHEKNDQGIKPVVESYRTTYPKYVVDLDHNSHESSQDALDEYNASYTNLTTDDSDEAIIINAPGITGKSKVMNKSEQSIRRAAKLQAIAGAGVSAVSSVLHFGLQTAADVVPKAEAIILVKMLKFDKTVEEIVARRMRKTREAQDNLISKPSAIMSKFKAFKLSRQPKVANA